MKTAVIYARYSSDSQTEQSIEGQLRECQKYAKANDILILDTYIDRAMTGTNDNRLDFQRMLKDSGKRQWDYVIVYKLDRFSRNKYESVIHKKALWDNGVKLLSAMEQIPDTPEGTLMEALLEGFNQYYSEELAQKVNRGIRESWLKGNATGGFPVFGYDVVNKKYVINEYEAAIVVEAFTKYAQGYKARAIAKDMQERGVRRKNGKLIDAKYIYYILHNPRYTGRVEHHGIVYDNIFPRIISDELWYAVQTINDANKIAPSRKKEIFDYILSGKLVCGNCKHRMSGESGTSHTGDIHYYYLCLSRRRRKHPCNMKTVHKQYLEDLVVNATMEMLRTPDNLRRIAEAIFKIHEKETSDNTTLRLLIKKRDEAVRASNNLIKAIEQGIITEMTKTRLRELETEIMQYEFDIEREKQRTYTYLTVESIEAYLQSMMFDNPEDIKIRKIIVNTFVREIILYDDRVIITYNFTDTIEPHKIDTETITETERQITSAFSKKSGSYIILSGAPKKQVGNRLPAFLLWETDRKNPTRLGGYGRILLAKFAIEQSEICSTVPFPRFHSHSPISLPLAILFGLCYNNGRKLFYAR